MGVENEEAAQQHQAGRHALRGLRNVPTRLHGVQHNVPPELTNRSLLRIHEFDRKRS